MQLDVHHHLYERGKAPWSYSDDVLETYCRRCHQFVEVFKKTYPTLSTVKLFYKEKNGGEYFQVFVVCMEKSKILLAVYNFYGKDTIDLVAHIPTSVIKIVSSLINIQS